MSHVQLLKEPCYACKGETIPYDKKYMTGGDYVSRKCPECGEVVVFCREGE